MSGPIRVLVVDDSETARMLVSLTLESHPEVRVIGWAKDGVEALALARDLKPDVITMDVRMPVLDGLSATEQIMATMPTPIVVVSSSVDAPDLQIAFRALRAGALDVIEKPRVLEGPAFERSRQRLVDVVRAMSEVRVVRRRIPAEQRIEIPASPQKVHRLVAIGASTGGPQLLGELASRIPADFPAPILAVQHMAPGFTAGFAKWLQGETGLRVKLAEAGEGLVPGTLYVAPDERHFRIDARWHVELADTAPVGRFRPSVDELFRSVAAAAGASSVGVLLTGMGVDGAVGLKALRDAGGFTIVQEPSTCVVSGMPTSAIELGAAEQQLSPAAIPDALCALTGYTSKSASAS